MMDIYYIYKYRRIENLYVSFCVSQVENQLQSATVNSRMSKTGDEIGNIIVYTKLI